MTDFGLQSLQAVWFTPGGIKASAGDLYQAFHREQAATTQSFTAAGVSIASGTKGSCHLKIQVSPGRIDYVLESTPLGVQSTQLPLAPRPLSLLSDIGTTVDEFLVTCDQACVTIKDALRVALLANTARKADSQARANEIFAAQTKFSLPFDDATDLLFQINRKTSLTSVPDVEINRFMKWAAVLVHTLTLTNMGPPSTPVANSLNLVTLSVDINTMSTGSILSADQQRSIFNEIAAEAKRLSQAFTLSALEDRP